MRKIAIAIESDPSGNLKVVGGPSTDVASVTAFVKSESVSRGNGDNEIVLLTTNGIEKRFKIAAIVKSEKSKAK